MVCVSVIRFVHGKEPCCCGHAVCGFRSSFVNTVFSPSATAARSFSRSPSLALREGFKGNLATASAVRFAEDFS